MSSTTEESDQIQQRRANLDALRALGVDVYPHGFDQQATVEAVVAAHSPSTGEALEAEQPRARTAGRILSIRSFGKANFLVISDGKARLQIYVRQDALSERDFQVFKLLDFGDWIGVDGRLFRTKTNELSVWASSLTFLSKCLLPLPEKWHGLQDIETRYRQRYLDLTVNPDSRRVFEIRSRVVTAIRAFLIARGFLEVETPMMHPIAGGAIARPFVTHHNTLDMRLYMRIAPELYLKRLTVGGMERVFEINRNFRNEGISTQHNPEFTMLEFYWAYAEYQGLMTLTEQMLAEVAVAATGGTEVTFGEHAISFAAPFRRLSLREAAREAASAKLGEPIPAEALRDRAGSWVNRFRPKRCVIGPPPRRWPRGSGSTSLRRWGPAKSPPRSSRRCARMRSSSRPLSTTFRQKSHPSPSRSRTTRTPSSALSSISPALKSPTPSRNSTIRWSSGGDSRSSWRAAPVATTRPMRWTRTTSARWSMGCRQPAARVSASTGW